MCFTVRLIKYLCFPIIVVGLKPIQLRSTSITGGVQQLPLLLFAKLNKRPYNTIESDLQSQPGNYVFFEIDCSIDRKPLCQPGS